MSRDVCAAVAHSLRGEYAHIGDAVREIAVLAQDSEEIRDECEAIRRSVEHSKLALRRLLDYVDVGQPIFEQVSLVDVVKRAEVLAAPRIKSHTSLSISVDQDAGTAIVLGNEEQLLEVVFEIANNAGKALSGTGGSIEVGVETTDTEVLVTVKDNGPGFPEDLSGAILEQPVRSRGKGLGIGLYLSRRIARDLGGDLTVENAPEGGALVTLRLPRAKNLGVE